MENVAYFQFFNSLNDFLAHAKKNTSIHYAFNGSPCIKDSIEAIGIPHTEVDNIIVNKSFVDFHYSLQHADEVEVYPFVNDRSLNSNSIITPFVYPLHFIVDVNAGKLSKELRMLGFDTTYQNNFTDVQIADIAEKESRVVLTRDVALLKQKKIRWGYWLRSQQVNEQLHEVVERFSLQDKIEPFVRCIECNGKIELVSKKAIEQQLQPKTKEHFNEFYQCECCRKVYWKGSHYEEMVKKIEWLTKS